MGPRVVTTGGRDRAHKWEIRTWRSAMNEEQREQNRIPCDIILNKVEDGHTNVCRAENLSLGGIKLRRVAEAHEAGGQKVQLQFALPGDSEPLWVSGEKVYEDDGTVGVRFTNISHGNFVKLRDWLRSESAETPTTVKMAG